MSVLFSVDADLPHRPIILCQTRQCPRYQLLLLNGIYVSLTLSLCFVHYWHGAPSSTSLSCLYFALYVYIPLKENNQRESQNMTNTLPLHNANAMADQQPDPESSHSTTVTHEKQLQPPPTTPPPTTTTDIDSIHADLFDMTASSGDPGSAFYSKATGTSTSKSVEESEFVKATWRLKLTIVMCMLALPIGCHYLEATVGTLKTALKHVSQG